MSAPAPTRPSRHVAWIDGVGTVLLCGGSAVSFGGPAGNEEADAADVALLADLARVHATVERSGEGHLLRPHRSAPADSVRVAAADGTVRRVEHPRGLEDGDRVELGAAGGGAVRLRFRRPNPLSGAAVLTCESNHRPAVRLDAVVLADAGDAVLLGPGREHHVRCPDAGEPVVLFRRGDADSADGGWAVRGRGRLTVGGTAASGPVPLPAGVRVESPGVSFHLGPYPTA